MQFWYIILLPGAVSMLGALWQANNCTRGLYMAGCATDSPTAPYVVFNYTRTAYSRSILTEETILEIYPLIIKYNDIIIEEK